jgi:hypothetical protein
MGENGTLFGDFWELILLAVRFRGVLGEPIEDLPKALCSSHTTVSFPLDMIR